MEKYKAVDGTTLTDEGIEKWATEAESEQGYTGAHLGPSVPGRPVSVGAAAGLSQEPLAHRGASTASELVRPGSSLRHA